MLTAHRAWTLLALVVAGWDGTPSAEPLLATDGVTHRSAPDAEIQGKVAPGAGAGISLKGDRPCEESFSTQAGEKNRVSMAPGEAQDPARTTREEEKPWL